MGREKIRASVGILTLNCKDVLPRALESVKDLTDVFICDGNSTDGTLDVARQHGARIVKQFDTSEPNQKITDFGAARTKCVNASLEAWHLRLDSDEYISPDLAREIARIVSDPKSPARVYKVPRKYVWRGNIIDDTITYPNYQMRFFQRDAIEGYAKITHERVVVRPGERIERLPAGAVMYVPLPDTYEAFDANRLSRALEWDRRQYEKTLTPRKWAWALVHSMALLTLYTLRLVRVRVWSRGNKLPLSFELWRFKYLIAANALATPVLLKKFIFL